METIVRYSNRKYYSKTNHRYVTLDYLSDLIKDDKKFQVTQHGSNQNITQVVVLRAATLSKINTTQMKKFLDRELQTEV